MIMIRSTSESIISLYAVGSEQAAGNIGVGNGYSAMNAKDRSVIDLFFAIRTILDYWFRLLTMNVSQAIMLLNFHIIEQI
jgi:hypothetical protein